MTSRDTLVGAAGVTAILGLFTVAQVFGLGMGSVVGVDADPTAVEVDVTGQAKMWGQRGARNPVSGDCIETTCRGAFTNVTMVVEGLPELSDLRYVVQLAGTEDRVALGPLEPTGDGHRIVVNRTGFDGRSYVQLQVGLSVAPDEPSGPVLLLYDYGPIEETRPGPVDLSGQRYAHDVGMGWSCCGEGDALEVEMNSPGPFEEVTRCAWLVEGARVYGENVHLRDDLVRFVLDDDPRDGGRPTLDSCETDDPTWSWDRRGPLYDAGAVLVTYESADAEPTAEPGGFPIFKLEVFRSK